VPFTRLHLYPLNGFSAFGAGVPQGSWAMVWTLALVAAAVMAVGAINFVNLMTARAGRRAVEVGVRKTSGARRRDLVLQFVGEAVLYALIAWAFAVAAVELILPAARAALGRAMPLEDDPWPLLASLALAIVVGALSGVYPALVQSRFRPAAVLKASAPQTAGSALARAGLTTLQFAALIGLGVAVTVIGRQTHFTLNQGLNLDRANVVTMQVFQGRVPGQAGSSQAMPPCRAAFVDQVRALPGVVGAACADSTAMDSGDLTTTLPRPGGATLAVLRSSIDFGFLELYGQRPLAGRFFARSHPEDETPYQTPGPHAPRTAVINRMMVAALGFASPAEAVGKTFEANIGPAPVRLQIIGVTPDFAFDLLDLGKWPRFYVVNAGAMADLSIKLQPGDPVGTLRAIDALWRRTGSPLPPSHRFVDDYLQSFYLATIQQGWMLDALCAAALFLACLGLFGLAAFTAERRTKEIGVRKAMGASTPDIVALLLKAFARPVLWANLVAWPLAWWALSRWLDGFVRHIPLEPWMFLAAAGAALLLAWATVLLHTLRVAAASPATALRYE
jgi:putative ABC transport system permease protein